jgi:hypothetical protein
MGSREPTSMAAGPGSRTGPFDLHYKAFFILSATLPIEKSLKSDILFFKGNITNDFKQMSSEK